MSPIEQQSVEHTITSTDLNRLPSADRIASARNKYAAAVDLYASSSASIKDIAMSCGLSHKALSRYISTHHRNLLFKRYGIEVPNGDLKVKIRPPRGQARATHLKYKDAVEACGDIAYIECNISQIARIFDLNPTALSFQLRVHYPDILPTREALRKRLGIADGFHRGPKPTSKAAYEEGVELYRNSDLTIDEIADRFGISKSGFGQYMRFYHHEAIAEKAMRRREAMKKKYHERQTGLLSGNGQLYGPKKETEQLYARAIGMYGDGENTMKDVMHATQVPPAGFKHHLDQWHRTLRHDRKQRKYAAAIESLRENPRSVAAVAKDFNLNPDVFREYLKKHVPQLADTQGMVRLDNGKLVKRSAWEKYRPAIDDLRRNGDTIRSIAQKHGLKYQSLLSFIKRMNS